MACGILSLLQADQSVKEIYRAWRNRYRDDTEDGTLEILQFCVDFAGYGYILKLEEIENAGNMRDFVRKNIVKSSYRELNIFSQPTMLKRIFQLFEMMIAHDRQELLQNNIWLNKTIRLLVAFCEVNDDECKMVAGYLSTIILVNLSVVHDYVLQELGKVQHEGEREQILEAEKRERYVSKVSKLLGKNIEGSCGYAITLPMISEWFCKLLETYPAIHVLSGNLLEVLATLLQHRHCKMFSTVANCFKKLLNPDIQTPEVVDAVADFFVQTAGKRFVQYMLDFKSSEKLALEVIVYVQRRSCGRPIFNDDISTKVRQYMFHSDETVRGYAIDFHVSALCHPDQENNNVSILFGILKLFERYEQTSKSLDDLVADLWHLEFFDDWSMVFNLLEEQLNRNENLFMVISVVHVINQCHALMMRDLEKAQQPERTTVDRARLRILLKDFLANYPQALRKCILHEEAYIALLQPAQSTYHGILQICNVNVEQYYEALFAVLSTVAYSASSFYVLLRNLSAIRSYWGIIIDVEQMWSELLNQYASEFVETRTKFTSRNIGRDHTITSKYVTAQTKLTALLELDQNLDIHLPNIMKILINDIRLLDKMKLNNHQTSIFYRLYKCAFYTIVNGYSNGTVVELLDSSSQYNYTGQRLKKRVLELLRLMLKKLTKFDESLETSVHVFATLCDLLLMTQSGIDVDVGERQHIGYAVETVDLEKMAKYLLNYLFSKQYDWHETPIAKQKEMLAKYIDLYKLHKSLPRITDTHYIVANFSVDTQLEKQLIQLMVVLHQVDLTQFCEVISQAAFQLLMVYRSEHSVKQFFKKFQSFALAKLTVVDKEECANVIGKVVEKMLNHMMNIVNDEESAGVATRMLKLVEPMLPQIPVEERLSMEHLLLRHSEYEKLPEADRKAVNRFVKHLKK
ncbi:uncharacterized protein LOC131681298 [Topomyia yanbarensis]|uniref:uncharacterized protein LOC131681298 n=1 Tax=Topomyia yanbarensis TaxID=2498891 RepID=UPI00273CCA3C|nr:uncharacterized protein LOC131681298 [Topomyia yanbarensis]